MTLEVLTQYYDLQKKIWDYETTIESLRAAAESTTSQLSDMPKSPNLNERLSRYVALIVDMEAEIEKMKPEAVKQRAVVDAYVKRVDDCFVKVILSLRFLEIMTWGEVAEAVGGKNTDDTVRMVCQRYIDKGNQ